MNREIPRNIQLQEILVLDPDRLRGAVVARSVSKTFPAARVYCESEPSVAASILAQHDIELFLVAVRGFDLDILTLLGVCATHNQGRTRVLVMTPEPHSTALDALRSLPITGVFDSRSSNLRELERACRLIANGFTYRSRSLLGDAVGELRPIQLEGECQTSLRAMPRALPPSRVRINSRWLRR